MSDRRRLAVLGSPIAHSLSPALHAAAYRELRLDWTYGTAEVASGGLPGFLTGLDESWRGLSLTMPLKAEVVPLVDDPDESVTATGVANTVVLSDAGRSGYNTDVHGVVQALADAGVSEAASALVLGAGATARSATVALAGLGVQALTVAVRDVTRADEVLVLGESLGMRVRLLGLGDLAGAGAVDVAVSTLPNGAEARVDLPLAVREHATLLDVAYDPWPTPLAAAVLDVGGRVVPGLKMLLHQAIGQVRVFTGGRLDEPLPGEPAVEAAMRAAVGLPAAAP